MASSRVCKRNILTVLADYRLMSAEQLSIYFQVSKAAIWKHIRKMVDEGEIKEACKESGKSRGRPEVMYSLTEKGVNVLRDKNILRVDMDNRAILADNLEAKDHQIMQNRFRLHLVYAKYCGKILFDDISSNSSLYWKDNYYDRTYHPINITTPDEKKITFIPDLVFRTYDPDSDKSLLYFVEIDRGTESQSSKTKDNGVHITGKILNYLEYWYSEGYKQYEDIWQCEFCGFRLLFVTKDYKGRLAICDTVMRMDEELTFIWITDIGSVLTAGIGGHIWQAGGSDSELYSILGSKAFDCSIQGVKFNIQ